MKLSVVIPVYNEAAVLPELARRARAAALSCDAEAEVILVDDASRDATRALAPALADAVVRFVHLADIPQKVRRQRPVSRPALRLH